MEGKREYQPAISRRRRRGICGTRDHKHGLKLYVQRVFIMDDTERFASELSAFRALQPD